jgi:hypothetical protein
VIRWSQPEIVLYDDDPIQRMSYPDLIEDGGKYFLTETQKEIARVHEIDAALLEGLWKQLENPGGQVTTDGLLLELPAGQRAMPASVEAPQLPLFLRRARAPDHGAEDLRSGFSIEMWLALRDLSPGQALVDNRTPDGKGLVLGTVAGGGVEIVMNDGQTENRWASDPDVLTTARSHHVAVVVDGGPKIISFIIDGKFCDGGEARQFGWGRFSPNLRSANGGPALRIGEGLRGEIQRLRIYGRALRTSEVISNFRAGT